MVAATTARQLRTQIARELGDSRYRVFTVEQIDGYILKASNQFVRETRLLWDMHIQEDKAFAANFDFDFEYESMELVEGQSNYDFMFERAFLFQGDQGDFAGVDYPEEATTPIPPFSDAFKVNPPAVPLAPQAKVGALMELPPTHYQTERVTWDGRKLESLTSTAMGEGGQDFQYEQIYGDVYAFLHDKDGQNRIRRYRIPAGDGDHFEYRGRRGQFAGFAPTATFGPTPRLGNFARHISALQLYPPDVFISLSWTFAFSLSTVGVGQGLTVSGVFSSMAVSGNRGVIRRIPGFHPSPRQRGIVRRVSFDARNTRVEFQRRILNPLIEREFEIPRYTLRAIKSKVLADLRAIEGPFQSLKMVNHYKLIYTQMVERIRVRKSRINEARLTVMGAGNESRPSTRPPLARPPQNFPDTWGRRSRRRF